MIVSNIKYHRDIPFDDYLKMNGVSFSSLKADEFIPSAGSMLGSKVHTYINEPEKYDYSDAEMVIPIAKELRKHLGDSFTYLEKEVAVTADFQHNGMLLKYKGRVDLLKIGRLVVDIKVLSGSLVKAVERFNYDKQLSGYCLGTESPIGLIMAFNKLSKKVEKLIIKPDPTFWEYQCVRMGVPA